jgi:dTDP-4-dehydrorhamnose 3,5-epimerase
LETYKESFIKENFPDIHFIQDNESKSSYGVLRGLHFQKPPFEQTKLVRVIEGEVLDVAVDIRPGSFTYGMHESVILSGENKKQFLIPKGFAHGFVVLSDTAVFSYKVDNYYAPKYDSGILYNDPQLNIDWIVNKTEIRISEKDNGLMRIKDLQ